MYLMPVKCRLKLVKMVSLHSVYFATIKKLEKNMDIAREVS